MDPVGSSPGSARRSWCRCGDFGNQLLRDRHRWMVTIHPDQLDTNDHLRDYLTGWGIDPDQ